MSFTVLAMVVLGGMGNIWGVAIGAFIIYEIQSQGLKQLNVFMQGLHLPVIGPINLSAINFINYQSLLYGLALVGHDAAATGGPLPEPAPPAGAARGGDDAEADVPAADCEELSDSMTALRRRPRRTAPPALILQARKVTKRFGGLVAVRDVDFDIPQGAIVSLIGPNGAGKTTFFNVIAGLIDPIGRHDRLRRRSGSWRDPPRAWAEPFFWIALPVGGRRSWAPCLIAERRAPSSAELVGVLAVGAAGGDACWRPSSGRRGTCAC